MKQLHPSYKRFCVTLHVPTTDACLQDARLLSIFSEKTILKILFMFLILPHFKTPQSAFFKTSFLITPVMNMQTIWYSPALWSFWHSYESTTRSVLPVAPLSPAEDKIFKIQQFIDQHFYEDIKIDALSKEFFISNFYLSHKFKALTGLSPKQYLMSVRLKQASLMLLNTDLPVSQIAEKAGFSNHSNFIKSFKSVYQLLPKDFRLNK